MRCLYCGKQLAFLRRMTGGGEFCSEPHKHKYQEEYNRVALSRLMQAQSKPDEARSAVPNAAGAAQLVQTTIAQQSWTTVRAPENKRLSAPAEAPAHSRVSAPPRTPFIIEKPLLRKPSEFQGLPATAPYISNEPEISRPLLSAAPIDSFVSLSSRLLAPTSEAVPQVGTGVAARAASSDVDIACPITTEVERGVTCPAALEMAGLVRLEVLPVPPLLAEAQLDPETEPAFSSNIEQQSLAPAQPDPHHEPPLQNYRSLKPRPFLPSESAPVLAAGYVMPLLHPISPENTPLPTRQRIATADTSPSKTRPAAIKVKRKKTQASGALESQAIIDENTVRVNLTARLQDKDGNHKDKRPNLWGSVQKYLKNLVGCLLLAGLLGVAGSSLSTGVNSDPALRSRGPNTRDE